MRLTALAAFSAALTVGGAAQAAQTGWTLSGSVRGRYEAVEDQARGVPLPDETAVDLRTILSAEYDAGLLRFGGELMDSRVYGVKTGTVIGANEVNVLEPVQAYVAADFDDALGAGSHATLKAGRFTMDVGSRRLVADDDYRNTTNGFEGVRLDAELADGSELIAFYTVPQIRLPNDAGSVLDNQQQLDRETSDLVFWGAAASHAGPWAGTAVDTAFLRLEEHDPLGQATRDRRLSTVTGRIIRDPAPGHFDFEAEGDWQFGMISAGLQPNAPSLHVAAGFVHLRGAYQFPDAWKTRLAVEYEWVSGDEGGSHYGRFDTLYGSRRADYAPSGLYNTVGRANISSPALRLEVTPSKRLDAFLVARPMWLASKTDAFSTSGVRDATGASGRYAGAQLEGRLRYWLVPGSLRFEADGAYLGKGRFLKTAPNAGASKADTKYLSANLTWSF